MIEQDTVRLLRECDAGAKMGVDSLNDVIDRVKDARFKQTLIDSREEHEALSGEIRGELDRFRDEGKDPAAIASAMSWLKTHAELAMDASDATVADLMTDGCNMGVKSLSKYLNQYKAADEKSKTLAKRLIGEEEHLTQQIRGYL
ncbi:MAG: hypothetical protein IKH30_00955 [Clostridia bacterium]|nr:hypothetical protein [Clostridia bacterium]